LSNSQRSKVRKTTNKSIKSASSRARAANTTLDPEFEKLIISLIKRFTVRSLLSSAIILAMCEYALQHSARPREVLLPYALVSAFAVAFPYVRAASHTFREIKQLGIKRFQMRKLADAQFALEYFHRFGQMSFDRDGEAHYYLIRTLIDLGNLDTALKMDLWVQKHRSKFEWAGKSASAVQEASRRKAALESNAIAGTEAAGEL
jgi:hypothetical protein